MDDVKKLLAEFADRAVDGIPPADVDADVARGRRALRRIRARRRVTGVLVIAAVSTAVLAVGNQLKWWGDGQSDVAGGPDETASVAGAGKAGATAMPSPSPAPTKSDDTISMFSTATVVSLGANQEAWSNIKCALAPQGWTPQRPVQADHVLLTPPDLRTSDLAPNGGLDLRTAPKATSLQATRVTEADGKVFHLGTAEGRATGQVLLGQRWLVVQVPAGSADWNDELLRRFMASCTVN